MVQRYNILGRYTNQYLCLCSHAWSVEVSHGKIRVRRDWYQPQDPDRRVSGEVTYTPNEGIKLELIGDFSKHSLYVDTDYYPTILGVVEGSRRITLFGCLLVDGGGTSLVIGNETSKAVGTYSVSKMMDGWHFESTDQVIAKIVCIEYDGLPEWLCISGLKRDDIKIDWDAHTIDFHYELPQPVEFGFTNEIEASFIFSVNDIALPTYPTSFALEQSVCLQMKSEKGLTLRDVINASYRFQTFLMAGLRGESCVKRIYFLNPDYSVTLHDGRQINRRIDLFYHQHFTVGTKKWDIRSMSFVYPSIRERFSELIIRWNDVFSEIEPCLNLLMEQLRQKQTFSDNDFLNLAQAAETLHDRMNPNAVKMPKAEYKILKGQILEGVPESQKEFVKGLIQNGNNLSLRQRLNELLDVCPQTIADMFIPDRKTFVEEVLDSRNYYTHYALGSKKHILRGRDLIRLTKRLQELLLVDILLYTGVDESMLVQRYTLRRYEYEWLLEP